MPIRTRVARTLVGTLIVFAALVSVGLTAPPDGPFTIGVRPVFLCLDAQAIAKSRAHALGSVSEKCEHAPSLGAREPLHRRAPRLDVDITFWTLHVHFAWSAIPLTPASTKPAGTLL